MPLAFHQGKVLTNGRLNVARAFEYLTNANPPAIVITALPAGQRTPKNAPVELTFNRPMNRASVESAFLIQPPVSGRFEWSNDDRSFSFHHDEAFRIADIYSARILGTAEDTAGGTLDGDFDRTREGSPADDFVWTFRFPVVNDDFVDAQIIEGNSGRIEGTNRYASWDVGEPQPIERGSLIRANTVWYQWQPPQPDSWVTFDLTTGTPFDSILDVFTGTNITQLTSVASNDNDGTRTGSRATFAPVAGNDYFIRVSGKNPSDVTQTGSFRLQWYPTPAPRFTGADFSPSSGAPGAKIILTGTNFTGATAVLFNGASASFTNALSNNLDLRITAIVPPDATSGQITIITPHGSVTSTTSFQVIRPTLTLTRTTGNEVTLSRLGTTFSLESSTDLRAWTQVTSPGASNATIILNENHTFFRLRAP